MTHSDLVEAGRSWARRKGCRVVLHDPFRAAVREMPDLIAWRDGVSILLEAKTSRSDFLADAKKPWRKDPERGMGDWRFYIAPKGLLKIEELPNGWGLLELDQGKVIEVHGVPLGNANWWRRPFTGNKRDETLMLVSALSSPEAKPRPGTVLRRGIDVEGWKQYLDTTQPTQ
ncbi:hypothetical protein [Xanthomonas euvesicatoria]|uniref:hypothetical protein n=1 Tax=Xanthomonas euvesicatoria TaxID=456327 RepID=UPI00080E4A13|nr:hypothetical protein [Xanthomonas euvesicatoria]